MKVERPWVEYRLMTQIRALSQLPPNAELPRLPEEEETLLHNLSQAEDPVKWLEQTSGDTVVRMVLWRALTSLRTNLHASYRASQAEQHNIHLQQLGKPPRLTETILELLRDIETAHPTTISLEILKNVLNKLRYYSQDEEFRRFVAFVADNRDDILSILTQILDLPNHADVIAYIEEKYARIGAIETIRYLLSRVIPSPRSLLESSMKVFHPNISTSANGYPVTLSEVAIGRYGFALTLQTKISYKKLFNLPEGTTLLLAGWGGAEQVLDDQGYHYLLCYPLENHKGNGRTLNMRLQLLFYPAIYERAKQITLAVDHLSMSGVGFQPGQEVRRHHPHYVLESRDRLTWVVDVSQKEALRPRPWKAFIG
ncbi:hypothetical protein [Hydrogenibacillus sp. N12]|uniref:hypothetical protein n=1 Tax=Hydrogenibacillus sp. N12 TaxID=2866627 RepID=UPI001C7CF995|nr:hypothetical protein [Hydrogenibacillus sp. N12]QZA33377.1 hypothetical protein K2M58_02185 [Hydrogenibacillus sp. N12]